MRTHSNNKEKIMSHSFTVTEKITRNRKYTLDDIFKYTMTMCSNGGLNAHCHPFGYKTSRSKAQAYKDCMGLLSELIRKHFKELFNLPEHSRFLPYRIMTNGYGVFKCISAEYSHDARQYKGVPLKFDICGLEANRMELRADIIKRRLPQIIDKHLTR